MNIRAGPVRWKYCEKGPEGRRKMHRIMNFAIGTLMFLILKTSAKLAQSAPSGSYQQTCKDIGVRGDVLTARCQNTNKHWQNAQMHNISYYNSNILNDNGALRYNTNANSY